MNDRDRYGAMDEPDDFDIYDDDDLDEDYDIDGDDFDDEDFDATASRSGRLRRTGRRVLATAGQVGRQRLIYAADRGRNRLADGLEGGVDYLRSSDVELIADDLLTEIRQRPLVAAGVAIGVGYLLGKAIGVPLPGRKRKRGIKGQLTRMLLSSAAAYVASQVRQGIADQLMQTGPRSRPGTGSAARGRAGSPRAGTTGRGNRTRGPGRGGTQRQPRGHS